MEVHTDGSTSGEQEKGGTGIYVWKDGVMIAEHSFQAGVKCSSYTAECIALSKTIDWIIETNERDFLIITGSLSLYIALENNIWSRIYTQR